MTKKITTLILIVSVLMSLHATGSARAIEDGNYKVSVYGWHETKDEASMMAAMLSAVASISVSNGDMLVTVTFEKAKIMGTIDVDGTMVSKVWPEFTVRPTAESTEGVDGISGIDEGEVSFTFPLSTLDMPLLAMYVPVMGGVQVIRLKFDLNTLTPEEEYQNSYTVTGTAQIEQFGKYNVNVSVAVTDGVISGVDVQGSGYSGTYAEYNPIVLQRAIDGMKDNFIGLPIDDVSAINDVDVISGATYSSKAIIYAVMDALDLALDEEIINIPEALPDPGVYEIEVAYYTDVVYHSLLQSEKGKGLLRVYDDGNASLTMDLISGSSTEPLYLLSFKGYYDGDILKTDGVQLRNESVDEYTVCSQVTFPLCGLSDIYSTNTYLYVPAMKNLNGEMSGLVFDNGKFSVDSFVKVYWDTLTKKDLVVRDVASNKLMPSTEYIAEYTGNSSLVEGIMLVAMYDSDGRLIKIIPGIQGSSSVSFLVTNPSITDVKLMLWQNFNTIAPLSGASLYQMNK